MLRALDQGLGFAVTTCLVLLCIVVFAGVVARYVFNDSFTWTEEIGQLLFVYIIFLGIPLAHRQRAHIAIDLLPGYLPAAARLGIAFLVDVVLAYTTFALMVFGYDLMLLIGGVSPALQWPNWVKYAVIPLSCAAGLVYVALRGLDEGARGVSSLSAIVVGGLAFWLLNLAGLIQIPATSPSLIMMVAFVATLAIGVPVAFTLLFSAFLANLGGDLLPPAAVVQNIVKGAGQFVLLAIPFFLAAGALMNMGGLTTRLMDLAFVLVGHFRGGFAQVNVLSSMLYGGISGSSAADAALDSKLLVPQMVRNGYSPAFSCAITSSSAILPNIIPPSIAMLILASISNISVGNLFVAGIGAGLLLTVMLMATVYIIARRRNYGRSTNRGALSTTVKAIATATPVLFLAVIILGGIRGGAFTATEAGVIAVAYALFLGLVFYREYSWRALWPALRESAVESALVGLLIGAAAPFAWILIAEQIPQKFVELTLTMIESSWAILLLLNALMLVAGMFLSLTASMLILVPIFLPLMLKIGVDPVHFGIIVVVTLMIGGLTPPVGYLVFITSSITKTPTHLVFRECAPFIAALVAGLALITYIPAISMGLVWLSQ